jgi:small subunit ribosomal protein S19
MARSFYKGTFFPNFLIRLNSNKLPIRFYARSAKIPVKFFNATTSVYNGHVFKPFTIDKDVIGWRFGEFSPTRAVFIPKAKKKKQMKAKKKKKC